MWCHIKIQRSSGIRLHQRSGKTTTAWNYQRPDIRAFTIAKIPAIKGSNGHSMSDRKRSDGVTIIPWSRGHCKAGINRAGLTCNFLPAFDIGKRNAYVCILPALRQISDPSYELTKTSSLAISSQLFHSKLKTLFFSKSYPDSSSSPYTSIPR